jgi:very-short-patch-repair endonuclease
VVARRQLFEVGYTRNTVRTAVDAGHLHRIHRGVYAVGHTKLTLAGRRMAAVLAGGPEALLSHRSAVAHWGLRPTPSGKIEVTVPGPHRTGPAAIRIHNVRTIDPADRAVHDGIPVTSVPRALLDYASVAGSHWLRLAAETAQRLELLDGRELAELFERHRGRPGIKALRGVTAELDDEAPWTQSEAEDAFLALVRRYGLPEPRVNVIVAGELVDFHWPQQRLVVEVDGWRFHKGRRRFEEDRRRDVKLQLAGQRVARVTKRRIEREPSVLAAELGGLLRQAANAAAVAASGR